MSSNKTDSELPVAEDCEGRETFPIYLLSFVYSLLAALIIAHVLFRWHWRRRKLSRFHSSQPGDKSFKNKHMQEILRRDFASIQALAPDPRLVNKDHTPQEFGECPDGSDVPVHWYRMLAFDAVADFVSTHASNRSLPSHPTLPELLSSLELRNHDTLLEKTNELYCLARYNDGDFGKAHFQELQTNLQQLKEILDHNEGEVTITPLSLTLQPVLYRQSTLSCTSQDPLLRMSSTEVVATPEEGPLAQTHTPHYPEPSLSTAAAAAAGTLPKSTHVPLPSSSTVISGGSKRRVGSSKSRQSSSPDSELSPLVTTQLSPGSLLSPSAAFGQHCLVGDEPDLFSGPLQAHGQLSRAAETQV